MSLGSENNLEDLLREYRDGNVEAFEKFFRLTKKLIYAYVKRRIENPQSAQDITQEIFFRIHRYIVSFDRSKGTALNWVHSIAHNSIADHIRTQKQRQVILDSLEGQKLYGRIDVNDRIFLEEMIAQFYGHLEKGEIEILLDRLLNEESFNEIAAKQGIRTDHARQKFTRTLKKIRHFLK
jgi:RNA polymerase sigma factor (sigma-70 family)